MVEEAKGKTPSQTTMESLKTEFRTLLAFLLGPSTEVGERGDGVER
jgi:hypothetical protein